ncbi:MAG: hypothetical protein COU27_02095 [Candidatus Levybacteria bacterium CG10_big_fil_rev_8_21_14_0_10_36_7]|nr:MAG: hypothetical protein COU27_02095 [Candidatus Levybacteria bacterium CG10_big_fil_rev_8_21_14_0_10_36_7]
MEKEKNKNILSPKKVVLSFFHYGKKKEITITTLSLGRFPETGWNAVITTASSSLFSSGKEVPDNAIRDALSQALGVKFHELNVKFDERSGTAEIEVLENTSREERVVHSFILQL